MDSFFVEVERLRDPSLAGIPVAVGGTGPRGVIASASYEARRFGVRSAQPTSTALRLCPRLVVVPSDHGRYGEVSAEVFAIFRSITPLVEGLGLDEAFLDVGGLARHFEGPAHVGEEVRSLLAAELGLPASVGVASSKLVAKLASQRAKPEGLLHVPKEEELGFLHRLPAEALWGVGPATRASLARLGVETVGDIAALPRSALEASLGPTVGAQLSALAGGIDPRRVQPDSEARSISVEQTYGTDLESAPVVETALLEHSQRLSRRLRRSGLSARTVTLKVRFSDFETVTRSETLPVPVDEVGELFESARRLAARVDLGRPVRLLGLGAGGLEESSAPRQLRLGSSDQWHRVEEAVDRVRDRFGDGAVSRARLLGEEGAENNPGQPDE